MTTRKILIVLVPLCFFVLVFVVMALNTREARVVNTDPSAVIQEWIDLSLLLTTKSHGHTPPVAAHNVAYAGVSVYESVRFANPEARSLFMQILAYDNSEIVAAYDPAATYDWRIVANANMAAMMYMLYPNVPPMYKREIGYLEKELHAQYAEGVDETTITRSVALGQKVADVMIKYAASGGGLYAHKRNFPRDYVAPTGPGMWETTPRAHRPAMLPTWGEVRPFTIGPLPEAPPPPAYSEEPGSAFAAAVSEVYEVVQNLTPEQRAIADFWSDEPMKTATPAGHSLSILNQVLDEQNSELVDAAAAYARLGMGLHDAFIATWKAKYTYNLVRPLTVIRKTIDPNFDIPLDTPPFPEYPSGHAAQSAAAAVILADLFGDVYTFTDKTHERRSDMSEPVRSFASFEAFAEEAALSRLYGGIHYRFSADAGLALGREIGVRTATLKMLPVAKI